MLVLRRRGYVSEHLTLDAETQADLELFGEEGSLFAFLNRCRTDGGKAALAARMARPWVRPEQILDTQAAIEFISGHKEVFSELPSEYVALNVERYASAVMPMVRQTGPLEFAMASFSFWANDDHFYTKIIRGVQLSCRLLAGVRSFADRLAATQPPGELAPLLAELKRCLAKFEDVGDYDEARWFWRKLRLDQQLRMNEKATLTRTLEILYQIDALVALADITAEHGFILPTIIDGPVAVHAEGLVHPLVSAPVANPIALDETRRVLFLTGPNMAGKTTYLRAVATAIYMAQLGMGVPARSFRFVPIRQLLTSIAVQDDLNEGISFFRAEALRMKAIAATVAAEEPALAIMDEPFKGTNVKDAFDASLAVLQRFAGSTHCRFIVSSHLIELGDALGDTPGMCYHHFEAEEEEDRLQFDYTLREGVSDQRLGMRVLKEEGVFDLLDAIQNPEDAI